MSMSSDDPKPEDRLSTPLALALVGHVNRFAGSLGVLMVAGMGDRLTTGQWPSLQTCLFLAAYLTTLALLPAARSIRRALDRHPWFAALVTGRPGAATPSRFILGTVLATFILAETYARAISPVPQPFLMPIALLTTLLAILSALHDLSGSRKGKDPQ
ncbi:MAG: hypothetical protein K9H25_17205 [Rhodospirillum sp.]|nr:hypothetical protein [Rhodospirillum sp.]MCF8501790.1 hypothetical protein [Rhodospirillum sp.]